MVAGGSITDLVLSLPKQARIHAGLDIVDLFYQGQNVVGSGRHADQRGARHHRHRRGQHHRPLARTHGRARQHDRGRRPRRAVRRGAAATSGRSSPRPRARKRTEAGGIRTIGNEANPWLPSTGADLYAFFGVGNGIDYTALESVYLDPANLGAARRRLVRPGGRRTPARGILTAPSSATLRRLAEWLREADPEAFTEIFGATPPKGQCVQGHRGLRALRGPLARAFAGPRSTGAQPLPARHGLFRRDRRAFGSRSPSFNQFVRGYRAVQTLFPASLGYTDNLATYETARFDDLEGPPAQACRPSGW